MMLRQTALLSFSTALLTLPAVADAQGMQGMDMKGMDMKGMPMPASKARASSKHSAKPTSNRPTAKARVSKHPAPKVEAPATPDAMHQMDHSTMPGMSMPQSSPSNSESSAKPVISQPDMSGMEMAPGNGPPSPAGQAMPGLDMSGAQSMPGMNMQQDKTNAKMASMPDMASAGTALAAGDAPAPAPPTDHYADRLFPRDQMEQSRSHMMRESGAQSFSQVMFNLAEVQIRDGKGGYRWDGEAWFGGDINRLWLKTEGDGAFRGGVDSAEVQALYSRAIGPYFNLQVGARHDFRPTPSRTYAAIGLEGLTPYQFEVGAAAFVSEKGDVLGRVEGYYDQRITQRLILQPRVELNLSAQDVPENRIGAGLTNAELGLRLRYELARELAPYIGVSYDAKTGRTADFARADRKAATSTSFVMGIRFWF
jgi:copper resistance protein B